SALGIKYVQLNPGHSSSAFRPGDTIPVSQAGHPVEVDDFFDTFDQKTRDAPVAEGLRRRAVGARHLAERCDRVPEPVPRAPHAGDGEPVEPGYPAQP